MERLLGNTGLTAPTLDRMRTLVGLLGDPQNTIPAVHVTGTNGKGSTVRSVVELFGASGLTASSYTSPHLDAVNDRISIANNPLCDADFLAAINDVAVVEDLVTQRCGTAPSYFEILAAAAYNWFADMAHVNVIEVGMGGRWDATNVVDSQVSVITNIGEEHLEVIGPTLADVAFEKAGIISEGSSVVCGEVDPELVKVVAAVAQDAGCEFWQAGRDYRVEQRYAELGGQVLDITTPYGTHDEVFVSLHGAHQAANVAAAVVAVEAFFGRALGDDVVAEALRALCVPGRFEVMARSPVVVTDGAHNPLGAQALAATMAEVFGHGGAHGKNTALVIGVSRPHDPAALLEAVQAQSYSAVVATSFDWPRSVPAAEIAQGARNVGVDRGAITQTRSVADGIEQATEAVGTEGIVLVTGSLYVVSEARAYLAKNRHT